jgi:hypothetical protein
MSGHAEEKPWPSDVMRGLIFYSILVLLVLLLSVYVPA